MNNTSHIAIIGAEQVGNCLAAWFSGPWEGHPFQRILMSRFNGEKCSEAKVLQNTDAAKSLQQEETIEKGKCNPASLEKYFICNKPMITSFTKHINKYSNIKYREYPIT